MAADTLSPIVYQKSGGVRLCWIVRHWILRRAADIQLQFRSAMHAVEQRRRHQSIAIGAAKAVIRLEQMEALIERWVRCRRAPRQSKPSILL